MAIVTKEIWVMDAYKRVFDTVVVIAYTCYVLFDLMSIRSNSLVISSYKEAIK